MNDSGSPAAIVAVAAAVILFFAVLITAATTSMATGPGSAPSQIATVDIPADKLTLYRQAAATCPGMDWAILAAVGKIETDHGRSTLPGVAPGTENAAHAGGIMQFLEPTFESVVGDHPPPPGGAQPPSRYNAHDAIHAAATYLCDSGASTGTADGVEHALFTYNHSTDYVRAVLAQAERYRATAATLANNGAAGPGGIALAFAQSQLGVPYEWGGDGPARGDDGFDCSGLSAAAWQAAGISIPRTADAQYRALPPLAPGTPIAAGDLLFFGTPAHVHHVGIATGAGSTMIHAPDRGQTIRNQDATALHDYFAVARPTA